MQNEFMREYYEDITPILNGKSIPKETPLERPDLRCLVLFMPETNEIVKITDGVGLIKGNIGVVVKAVTTCLLAKNNVVVGTSFPNGRLAPKYTGPIDDEMLANILFYGR